MLDKDILFFIFLIIGGNGNFWIIFSKIAGVIVSIFFVYIVI